MPKVPTDDPQGLPASLFDGFMRAARDDAPAKCLPGLITDMQLVVIDGGPHAIAWTHADQFNSALLNVMA